MTESRACPECGADVPTGRLSCGACGALLASVEGRGAAEALADPTASATGDAPAPVDPPVRSDVPAPGPAEVPATVAAPPPPTTPEGVAPPPPMPPIPGAYLPPSAVMRGAPVTAPAPARTPAPVPAPLPRGPEPSEPMPGPTTHVPVLELPFAIAPGVGPRLVAAGAALAVVAFVLPWIPGGGIVIGGAFGSGYFATWGLAAIGNVLPFLLAWVSLVLAVLPNRVPRHAALGLLPVFLGGVFVGYGWMYLIAPYGIGIGIWALAGGAFLLLAGGSLVLRRDPAAG